MRNLAPIVLFTYNRPWHTRQTVEALQKNHLASQSQLFIYADGPKNQAAEEKVKQVREYLERIDGFKKVTVIKRTENWGLANSIIDGVTQIVNEFKKVIVLEDDIVSNPYFLQFLNEALVFYEHEPKVMHISGWTFPIDQEGLASTFLWRQMNCWGWATWADRWQYFDKDVDKTIRAFSKDDIKKFDLDCGGGFWKYVIANKKGKINTWAVFWYASIFKKEGLCLNPTQSLVKNIGIDGSGVHFSGSSSDVYSDNFTDSQPHIVFEKQLVENEIAVERVRIFLRLQKNPWRKIINKLKTIILR